MDCHGLFLGICWEEVDEAAAVLEGVDLAGVVLEDLAAAAVVAAAPVAAGKKILYAGVYN